MIELYDVGRTTHRAIPGMYAFIANNADRYVCERGIAEQLKREARAREMHYRTISPPSFLAMCDIWVRAYQDGSFPIDLEATVFPDTVPRFQHVRAANRRIGILTAASREFVDLLYTLRIGPHQRLSSLIDEYVSGMEIADKESPETFEALSERTGDIHAIFDDKPSVCRAAAEGFRRVNASAKIYLVDRTNRYCGDALAQLADAGVTKISTFAEVRD